MWAHPAAVPVPKSWWFQGTHSYPACPACQPVVLPRCVWGAGLPTPDQPRVVAAKRGIASVSYKKFVIIILIIIYLTLLAGALPESPCGAGAYEGQGFVLAPAWARCCRSRGCGGGAPGRAECSTRFLIQPVMPEENLPLVSAATAGAPPM